MQANDNCRDPNVLLGGIGLSLTLAKMSHKVVTPNLSIVWRVTNVGFGISIPVTFPVSVHDKIRRILLTKVSIAWNRWKIQVIRPQGIESRRDS